VLYAASTSLPGLLQSLFGYDALNAGLVMSPAGFFAIIAMPVVGRLIGLGTDTRWLIAGGLLIMAAGSYWMSRYQPGPGRLAAGRVGPGTFDMFRARECGGLSLYAGGAARSGCRPAQSAA
jgi:hypothetical protein